MQFLSQAIRVGLAAALVLAVTAKPTVAADLGVTSKKLIVLDKPAAGKGKTVYVAPDHSSNSPGIIDKGTGIDPNQISVQFDLTYRNGAAAGSFMIPAGASNGVDGWKVNNAKIAKYTNRAAPTGATQAGVAIVKPGKLLKMVGAGLGDDALEVFSAGDPGAEGVATSYCVVNEGAESCHCSTFTDCSYKLIAADTGAKLVCKDGTPDIACQAKCGDALGPTRFVDQGATVLDDCTGLEWEKKTTAVGSGEDAGNLNDVDNRYSWAGTCQISGKLCQPSIGAVDLCKTQTPDGVEVLEGCATCGNIPGVETPPCGTGDGITTIWRWLELLNAGNFAGHADWRLATVAGNYPAGATGEPGELTSIVDQQASGPPRIAPIFGPTAGAELEEGAYWTASTAVSPPSLGGDAWIVGFGGIGFSTERFKDHAYRVRAVRSGP